MFIDNIDSELSIQTYRSGIKFVSPKDAKKATTKINHLTSLPFNVYLIDSNAVCRFANTEQANMFGYAQQDILNKPLKKFMEKSTERLITKNNIEVMKSQAFKFLDEEVYLKNDLTMQSLSIKLPWYNNENKICGVFGFGIILHSHLMASALTTIGELGFLKREQFPLHESKIEGVCLTKRENEILHFLLKGYPQKQIANIFSLSPRTVEFHLINIKNKFKVNSRSDLIDLLT